jgi:hypothetical protein
VVPLGLRYIDGAGLPANRHLERAMFRWTIPLVVAIATLGTAVSPEQAFARRGVHRAAAQLPAGLPRPHYKFRTTVSWAAPASYRRPYAPAAYAYETPDVLFTPTYVAVPYFQPAYYGSAYPYDYPDAYNGGPYVGYWDRMPYACGVYGYC